MLGLNTKVITQTREKEIQELVKNDFVLCPDNVWAEVIKVQYEGKRPIYRYTFGKYYLDCTKYKKIQLENRMCKIYLTTRLKILLHAITLDGPKLFTEAEYLGYRHSVNIIIDHPQHVYYANKILTSDATIC